MCHYVKYVTNCNCKIKAAAQLGVRADPSLFTVENVYQFRESKNIIFNVNV